MTMRMSTGGKIALYTFLVIMVIITVIPLLYTASASLKTNFEIAQGGINLIPEEPTFDNFKTVWGMTGTGVKAKATYADYTVNSIKVSCLSVVFVVVFTSMASYCFERGNFPGRKFLYWLFMATMFIGAGTITIFPVLQITSKLGLNNIPGLALVQFATAGASNLFLTMGYLKTISHDLDDAAKIDGCSFFATWWRIILPLSKPILATVALMTFRSSWNNYLLPNLMLSGDQSKMTLVVAVVKLQSSGGAGASQYNLMMAGTMLALMPMLILFLCMNKRFVAGITQGAVKG